MKGATPFFAALIAAACPFAHAADPVLVWSDEFDGASGYPDLSKWTYQTGGGGWGNGEAENYTNRRDANANAYIQDGKLVIEARKETYGANAYTSARLNSTASWTYGRIVVRAKIPGGQGTWPAIWMMPTDSVYGGWPASGEIDIMEHTNNAPTLIYGTLHTAAQNATKGNARGAQIAVADATEAFHDYRMDWTPQGIGFYVDDVRYFYGNNATLADSSLGSAYWPFDQRFHLILNVALGGSWGGTIDQSILPAKMEIDWIHVYDLGDSPSVPVQDVPGKIETESFSDAAGVQMEATSDTGGGTDVGWLNAGDWLDYVVNVAQAGDYNISFRYASVNGYANFTVSAAGGQALTVSNLTATGDWQAWSTATRGPIHLDAGQQTIRLTVNQMATADDFNLNWFDIEPAGTSDPGWTDAGGFGPQWTTWSPWVWVDRIGNWVFLTDPPLDHDQWVFAPRALPAN